MQLFTRKFRSVMRRRRFYSFPCAGPCALPCAQEMPAQRPARTLRASLRTFAKVISLARCLDFPAQRYPAVEEHVVNQLYPSENEILKIEKMSIFGA